MKDFQIEGEIYIYISPDKEEVFLNYSYVLKFPLKYYKNCDFFATAEEHYSKHHLLELEEGLTSIFCFLDIA